MSHSLVISVFLAPLFEELIFRGGLQGSLSAFLATYGTDVWTLILAVLIQSVVFALWHFNVLDPRTIRPIPFVLHFLGGVTLGYLTYRTNSIWPGVVIHAIGNMSAEMNT